jgi:integrase
MSNESTKSKLQQLPQEKSQKGKLLIFGEPMKRGSLNCQNCNSNRSTRLCPKCGWDAVQIKIMWKGTLYRFWHDRTNRPYSFAEGAKTLHTINQQIENRKFNPKDYLTSTIREMRFEVSFQEWLDLKKKEVELNEFSPETLRAYKSYFKNHYQTLYGKDLREIELKDLAGVLKSCHSSINFKRRLMECLHSFFGWLVRWGTLKEWPVFPPKLKGDDAKVQRAITYEQQIEAIDRMPEEHRDIFLFMRETGVRISEACAVQVRDLDLNMGKVLIQRTWSGSKLIETTKQKKKQSVWLSDTAIDIANRNMINKLPNAFLLINPYTKRGYRDEFLRRLWEKNSGINITLYEAMRHSTITDWATMGSAYDLQKMSRHTDIRTTMKYVHAADKQMTKMANRRAEIIPIVRELLGKENNIKENK